MRVLSMLLISFFLISCGGQASDEPSPPAAEPTADAPADATAQLDSSEPMAPITVASAVRPVACGCAIEGIGHCGNYVEVDGQHYEIANSSALGLGGMEWCGRSGATAQTAGQIVDGRFVATEMAVKAE